MKNYILQIIIIVLAIWTIIAISTIAHLFYNLSIDQSIGAAIAIIGIPTAYVLGIGAAIHKHFNKPVKKETWTVIKPGHIIRNS